MPGMLVIMGVLLRRLTHSRARIPGNCCYLHRCSATRQTLIISSPAPAAGSLFSTCCVPTVSWHTAHMLFYFFPGFLVVSQIYCLQATFTQSSLTRTRICSLFQALM